MAKRSTLLRWRLTTWLIRARRPFLFHGRFILVGIITAACFAVFCAMWWLAYQSVSRKPSAPIPAASSVHAASSEPVDDLLQYGREHGIRVRLSQEQDNSYCAISGDLDDDHHYHVHCGDSIDDAESRVLDDLKNNKPGDFEDKEIYDSNPQEGK